MKIVKSMKGMKKSALPHRGAATAARRASPPRDVMAPLRAQVIFMLFTAFMTFMSFLEICLENH